MSAPLCRHPASPAWSWVGTRASPWHAIVASRSDRRPWYSVSTKMPVWNPTRSGDWSTSWRQNSSIGAASGKLLRVLGPEKSPGRVIDTVGIDMRAGRRAVDLGQGEPDDGRYDSVREVFGVSAAVALYRRSALSAVAVEGQVFDERFFMYKEDVDLAWRLRAAGYRAVVDGTASGYHGRSVGRTAPTGGRFGTLGERWRREREKPRWVREQSWRNQWLMMINNDRPTSMGRWCTQIAINELALLGIGFVLDPIATVRMRLQLIREVPSAMRRRRVIQRLSTTDLGAWIP